MQIKPLLCLTFSEILCIQVYLDTILTLTSSGTWTFDTTGVISYRFSIVTECVSPAIFEIMGPNHIGVTTSTFNHVAIRFAMPFPIGGPLEPCQKYSRYSVLEMLTNQRTNHLTNKHDGSQYFLTEVTQ